MSFTRRHWLATTLMATFASLLGLRPAAGDPTARRPRRRAPAPKPGEPYQTRWIGHY